MVICFKVYIKSIVETVLIFQELECLICSNKYPTIKEYCLHVKRHVVPEDLKSLQFNCPICLQTPSFTRVSRLREHLGECFAGGLARSPLVPNINIDNNEDELQYPNNDVNEIMEGIEESVFGDSIASIESASGELFIYIINNFKQVSNKVDCLIKNPNLYFS